MPRQVGQTLSRNLTRLLQSGIMLASAAFASSGLAADEAGRFAAKGLGIATCEQFLQVREDKAPQYYQFGGWVNGYLTALNRYEQQTFDIAPWQSTNLLVGMLANFCEQRKDVQFVQAVAAMAKSLSNDRLSNGVDRVEARSGDNSVILYEATLRLVQLELSEAGYYMGEADGKYGRQTRKALEQYQEKMGLTKTGVPDQATLVRLFYK